MSFHQDFYSGILPIIFLSAAFYLLTFKMFSAWCVVDHKVQVQVWTTDLI